MNESDEEEIEALAKLLCATFSKERGFVWGDNNDFAYENLPASARIAWRAVAQKAMEYLGAKVRI